MSDTKTAAGVAAPAASRSDDVSLDLASQKRNLAIFAALVSMIFFAAPALYVGFVQGSLLKRLETSDTLANLPTTIYLVMAGTPVIVAWLFPQARLLKPLLRLGYAGMAVACGAVGLALLLDAPRSVIIGMLLLHAAAIGSCNGVVLTHSWELIRRAVSEQLRGRALQFAFGVGAIFAVVGSLGTQLLLDGKLFGWQSPPWMSVPYPYSYAALFAGCGVLMALGSYLAKFYRIPLPRTDVEREPFSVAILGGFRAIVENPVLRYVCLGYLLVFSGNMVQVNMSIFTREAVDMRPEDLVGYQLALRFGFKIAAGVFLGWLLTKTNPKTPLLVLLALQIMCVLWILYVPGIWFLLAFGLNGAGELFGVYFVNYMVSSSPKSRVRRNTAFLFLVSVVVGGAPVLYGWISDTWNLRASFWTALAIFAATTVLVAVKLPAHPKPRPQDLSESDLADEVRA